jgi:hypothetical protein
MRDGQKIRLEISELGKYHQTGKREKLALKNRKQR